MTDRSKLLALAEADRIKDEEMTLRDAVRGVARRRKRIAELPHSQSLAEALS